MKEIYRLIAYSFLAACSWAQNPQETARPQISTLEIDPGSVTVLHLRPGYTTSVRMPEEVSSVGIGNPASFKAEHSEAEPESGQTRQESYSKPARRTAELSC